MNARTKISGNAEGRRSQFASHTHRTCCALLTLASLAVAAPAAPQIEVRVNNQVIATNQEVSLPDTALGDSTPLIVVLRNIGDQDLVFTGDPFISLAGGFDTYFSVIQPPLEAGDKLSPNGSTAFRVDFTPQHVADRLDTKAFIFTNSTPAVFAITFVGRSTGPRMIVKQDGVTIADAGTVIFPDTPIGETSNVQLVIENAGSEALQLTAAPQASLGGGSAALFAITQQPNATVPAGGSTTMEIAFTPAAVALATTGLFIAHNEQSLFQDGLFGATVQARGLPAVEIDEAGADDIVNENVNDNQHDDNDKADGVELENDDAMQPIGNPCGFGSAFAVPACLFGLCSARASIRRRVSHG